MPNGGHKGGTTVTVNDKPGDIPLFVRENTLLPLARPVQEIGTNTVFKIAVTAVGDSPSSFTLYEDDGMTFDFETGAVNQVVLTWDSKDGGKVKRTGNYPGQRYKIEGWTSIPGPKE